MPEETEIKSPQPSSRDRLTDRYRKSRPDLDWDTEGVDNDIDALAADELDAYDKDKEARSAMDEKMNKLFENESASRIFVDWANGKDPIENLIEYFGEDLLDALQSEEGKEKFKTALEKWRTGKTADEEHTKSYDVNLEQSAKNLVAFADKHGLDDEKVSELAEKVHTLASDVLEGLYSEEILEMALKSSNYDKDVEDAREEGRVTGKNENIVRELRKSKPANNLPPTAGSQAAVSGESTKKPRSRKLDMFGGIEVK